jgi:hypothetical protein
MEVETTIREMMIVMMMMMMMVVARVVVMAIRILKLYVWTAVVLLMVVVEDAAAAAAAAAAALNDAGVAVHVPSSGQVNVVVCRPSSSSSMERIGSVHKIFRVLLVEARRAREVVVSRRPVVFLTSDDDEIRQ